jgi:hypothetical protein
MGAVFAWVTNRREGRPGHGWSARREHDVLPSSVTTHGGEINRLVPRESLEEADSRLSMGAGWHARIAVPHSRPYRVVMT